MASNFQLTDRDEANLELEQEAWLADRQSEMDAADAAGDEEFDAWLADRQSEMDARSDRLEAQAANWG